MTPAALCPANISRKGTVSEVGFLELAWKAGRNLGKSVVKGFNYEIFC